MGMYIVRINIWVFLACSIILSQEDTTRYFLTDGKTNIDWSAERASDEVGNKPYYTVIYSNKNEIIDIQYNAGKKNRLFDVRKWIPFLRRSNIKNPKAKVDTVFVEKEVIVTVHDTVRIHNRIPQSINFILKDPKSKIDLSHAKGFFEYWNPYQVQLNGKNEFEWFYQKPYYEAQLNKDGRIKTVSYFNREHICLFKWKFIWSKSGDRYEYDITFLQKVRLTDIDPVLFSDILSDVRQNWVARFKTRNDGRPKEVGIFDNNEILYYRYIFNYKMEKNNPVEKIRSSYFRGDSTLAGSHLIYNDKDQNPIEIYRFNQSGQYQEATFIQYSPKDESKQITIHDSLGVVISRRIIGWNPTP